MSGVQRIAARGLAIPFPAMSGAEPWTGSNMLGKYSRWVDVGGAGQADRAR